MASAFACGGANDQRDCTARKGKSEQSPGKGKQNGKSWSKSECKGKGKVNVQKPKGKSKGYKGAKHSNKGEGSTTGLSSLEQSKSKANSESHESEQAYSTESLFTDSPWCDDSWSCADWNDGWSSVGWHEGWDEVCDNYASSLFTSSPKRCEWVRKNLDTGAAVNTFPLIFGPEGAGDGRFYRTASVETIPDGGPRQFQSCDENGLL